MFVHSREPVKLQEPRFQCELCGRSFLWTSNPKTHQLYDILQTLTKKFQLILPCTVLQ